MIFYKFKPFLGSQVYRFIDPDTGFKFEETTMKDLIQHIVGYRSQNNLEPIDNLDVVLENYLCQQPENTGSCIPRRFKRSFLGYLKGGIALLSNLAYDTMVSQEIADERSSICSQCPHNTFPDKGAFLHWADRVAEASVGKNRSKYHDDLGNCGICSCPLRAKVFYKGKLSLSEEEIEEMPDFCWQKKEALNGRK